MEQMFIWHRIFIINISFLFFTSSPSNQRFNSSIFAVEYPGYGPAEGDSCEESVNDNVKTAFEFLLSLGYPTSNIVIMGYSIGTGPTIQLASELCDAGTPPGAIVTIAAFLSICDIVRDLRRSLLISLFADAIANRWNSGEKIKKVTCPSMFVHGLIDEVIPYEHSEKLFQSCPAEGKRLRLVPEADHIRFEEPVDTVQPIAAFLKENLKPDNSIEIEVIPAHCFVCPNSVLDREVAAKAGGKICFHFP